MAVNDIFRLHTVWIDTSTNLTMENSFVFKQTAGLILDTEGEDLVEMYNNLLKPLHRQCIHTNYHLDHFRVVKLPDDLTVYEASGNPDNAALTGDMMPPYVAGVITLRSATLGRRGRGRLFLGPVNEASNTSSGHPGAAFTTAMANLVQGCMDAVDNIVAYAGWQYGVWSEADQAFRVVTNFIARENWGRQVGRTK